MSADARSLHLLIQSLLAQPELKEALAESQVLKNGKGRYQLSSLPQPAVAPLALAIAQLLADGSRPPVLLVPDELAARSLRQALSSLTTRPILEPRPAPLDIVPATARSRVDELQLLAQLAAVDELSYGAIVLTADTLADDLPAPRRLAANALKLVQGEVCELDALATRLTELAYEAVSEVDAPGQFARRGDIVDIGIPDLRGDVTVYRLSFFGDEIDDLRSVDPISQRSLATVSAVEIPPARLLLLTPEEREILAVKIPEAVTAYRHSYVANGGRPGDLQRLVTQSEHDLERLAAGDYFPGLQRWQYLLGRKRYNLLDFTRELGLPLFILDLARVRERIDQQRATFMQEIRTGLEQHRLLPDVEKIRLSVNEQVDKITSYGERAPIFTLSQIGGAGLVAATKIRLQMRDSESYRQRPQELEEELARLAAEGTEVHLFAGKLEAAIALRQNFASLGGKIQIHPDYLEHGFSWPAAQISVFGTADLFHEKTSQRRQKSDLGTPIKYFSDLKEGELVVHEDHGIGRFLGLSSLETATGQKDYIEIAYAGEDKLFLPLEALPRIQKYLGADGREPKLSKLGGGEWERQKARARESIKKLAFDLTALYAKRQKLKGHRFAADSTFEEEFAAAFPYPETEDQLRSLAEIRADMESEKIMDRLICGDVGFGKTELAFRALFKAVVDGQQAAFLAPTTVLAQQHYQNFLERIGDFPVRVALLSRFVTPAKRREILKQVERGEIDVLIGTHSLLNKHLHFPRLKLLVIDEEQRFGVGHKEELKEKYPEIDVLSLSATPIPRTLHMSLAGIRDISILESGPEDRRPVQTYVLEYDPETIREAILQELARQGQVFYLINNVRAVERKAAELIEEMPGLRVRYAHGQMPERQLEDVILDFIHQEFDVLVCTTIIENGIDLPNVNTMIVEDADRLGLAQLYQIRGRVGRSGRQAYAYITYRPEKALTEDASKRLAVIRDFTELGSGFKIALRDLEVRGAGNLLGGEQHGQMSQIGYELYCRILDSEIRELQGEEPLSLPEERSVQIDFKLDALIPAAYIRDASQRMAIYRRILALRDQTELMDLYDELLDRFGEPPRQLQNLLDIAYLRARAQQLKITEVKRLPREIRLSLATDEPLPMEAISAVLAAGEENKSIYFSAIGRPQLIYQKSFASDREALTALNQLLRRAEHLEDEAGR